MSSAGLNGFAIWLMPPTEVAAEFRRVIAELAREFAAPCFEPHVTLAGPLAMGEAEVMRAARELARETRDLEMVLEDVGGEAAFFRCLYVSVEKSAALVRLRERAGERTGAVGEFTPHLSLLYGELGEAEKAAVFRRVRDERWPRKFSARGLSVVALAGGVEDWRVVGDVGFTAASRKREES